MTLRESWPSSAGLVDLRGRSPRGRSRRRAGSAAGRRRARRCSVVATRPDRPRARRVAELARAPSGRPPACGEARRRAPARPSSPSRSAARSRGPPRPSPSRESARARSGARARRLADRLPRGRGPRRATRPPRAGGAIAREVGERPGQALGQQPRAAGRDRPVDRVEQAAGALARERAGQLEVGAGRRVDGERRPRASSRVGGERVGRAPSWVRST